MGQKLNLLHIINVYADGFFGKNEDYRIDLRLMSSKQFKEAVVNAS